MIRKFALVLLGAFVILNSTYGKRYDQNRNTNITTPISGGDPDDYYDYYDYDISNSGCEQQMNQAFRYCFTLLIISCFY